MRRVDRYTRVGFGYLRRLLHALLSALVPGVGQLVGGAKRRGYVLLGIVVVLAAFMVALTLVGWDVVLSYVIDPTVLLGLLVANLVFLAFRLYAVVDAYMTGRPKKLWVLGQPPTSTVVLPASSTQGPAAAGAPGEAAGRPDSSHAPADPLDVPWPVPSVVDGTTVRHESSGTDRRVPNRGRSLGAALLAGLGLMVLLVFTLAPHVLAGYYAYLSRDLIITVFVDEEVTSTTTTAATTTTLSPTTTTSASSPVATSTTLRTPTTEPTTTTTTEPQLDWGSDNRLTVLLIGTDAGQGRRGARADSVNVATLDLDTGSVALFGIPRNTGSLQLSDAAAAALGTDTYVDMISNLYEAAQDHPELAPEGGDPGAVVLRDTLSRSLGIPIHHYAVVNMGGLVDLVDALGGIKINVKTRVWVRLSPPTPEDDWKVYDIQPGVQELDGHEALAFARSRTGNSDYDRMRRQRCVLMALVYQKGVTDLVLHFPDVVKVIQAEVRTDIPISRLRDLVRVRRKVKTDEMVSVGFGPPDYITGRNEMHYNILDTELVQATVQRYINEPEKVLTELRAQAEADSTGGSDCWKVD